MDMYTLNQIPSEAKIRKYLRQIVFGGKVFCPDCRHTNPVRYEDRYRCRRCKAKFSLTSHTWLSSMRLPLEQWWMLLWCWTKRIPVRQTHDLTGLSEVSVYHWFDQFRQHLPEEYHVLESIVQMDEAFFTDWCLMVGKQIGTRKLAWKLIYQAHPDKHQAASFLFEKVQPGSKLWTDGGGIYKNIAESWPVEHSRDIHKKFEFEHTSEIEGVFANLRTFIRRMYHHVTPDKFPDYVREFCFRFSNPELFDSPLSYAEKTLMLVPIR